MKKTLTPEQREAKNLAERNRRAARAMPTKTLAAKAFIADDRLREIAPAVFSKDHDPRATEEYQFISTLDVLERLKDRGYGVVEANQNRTVKNPQWAFHTLRLQKRTGGVVSPVKGDTMHEQVILMNSHDRTRRLSITAGFFRLICSNGLTAPLLDENGRALATKGKALHLKAMNPDRLIEEAIHGLDLAKDFVARMQDRILTPAEQKQLASFAIDHIYGGYAENLEAVAWLNPRRAADAKPTLWHTFNVIQENMTVGGVVLPSRRTTSPLGQAPRTGAMTSVRFNEALWAESVRFLLGKN